MKRKALWVGLLVAGVADWLLLNLVVGPAYLPSRLPSPLPSDAVGAAAVSGQPAPRPSPVAMLAATTRSSAGGALAAAPGASSRGLSGVSTRAVGEVAVPAAEAGPGTSVEVPGGAPSLARSDMAGNQVAPRKPLVSDDSFRPAIAPSPDPLLFSRQSAEITAANRRLLRKLAKYLRSHSQTRLAIDGHADRKGKAAFNEWLSLQRARAVRAYLHGLGVPLGRMAVRAHGSRDPADPSGTEEARAKNRRVEITLE